MNNLDTRYDLPLGRKQRAVLEKMHRNGGIWPQQWRIRSDDKGVFASLVRRGLISQADGVYRVVTR
jgi:hypothetical protein